ncbi:MAG: hypothetical protein F6K16_41220 [Symploca sp. SIO2B6]|nr:hypothetical protein [Symploca sp. SIO2B6]
MRKMEEEAIAFSSLLLPVAFPSQSLSYPLHTNTGDCDAIAFPFGQLLKGYGLFNERM